MQVLPLLCYDFDLIGGLHKDFEEFENFSHFLFFSTRLAFGLLFLCSYCVAKALHNVYHERCYFIIKFYFDFCFSSISLAEVSFRLLGSETFCLCMNFSSKPQSSPSVLQYSIFNAPAVEC